METIINDMPSGYDLMKGYLSVEIGYPWISRGAIIALEEILDPEFTVLELGCGGSTVFFSNRCKYVKSFDSDLEWVEKVRDKVKPRNNVEFVCGSRKRLAKAVLREPDKYYDIALVDIGIYAKWRLPFAEAAAPKIKRGGYLVIDNYDIERIRDFDCSGWDVYTFDDMNRYMGKIIPCSGKGTRILIKR